MKLFEMKTTSLLEDCSDNPFDFLLSQKIHFFLAKGIPWIGRIFMPNIFFMHLQYNNYSSLYSLR